MSSLSKRANGSYRIQLRCPDGKRRAISLRGNKRHVTIIQSQIEAIAEAKVLGQALNLKQQKWIREQPDYILQKLALLQLYHAGKTSEKNNVGSWCDFYVENYGHKHETKCKLRNVAEKLCHFFGADTLLQEITKGDAARFYIQLSTPKNEGGYGLAKSSTAPRHLGYCRQIFEAAVDKEVISINPFSDRKLSAQVKPNKERHFYVDAELSQRVLDAMPNRVWRLRWCLMRYQGLRCPSEMNSLRWDGVDWAGGKLKIYSPKTAYIEGKASRLAAIMPDVLPYLEQMFEEAEDGSEMILPQMSHKNYRKMFLKYLGNYGIEAWPALFNNLRKSAATDAHDWLPAHVCEQWFGHSETIFKDHYGQVTEEHYRLARDGNVTQPDSLLTQRDSICDSANVRK